RPAPPALYTLSLHDALPIFSTVVHLFGGGVEGAGEDVVYDAEDHVALQDAGAVHDLAGRFALGEFCELIDGLDLFPVAPQRDVRSEEHTSELQSQSNLVCRL